MLISSRLTTFHKRIFPAIWFGIIALSAVLLEVSSEDPRALIVPAAMAVVGFVIMKLLVWNLVDEVEDHGDYLVVRNGDDQERIALSNIMNVSATTFVNPPRVTLRLVTPGRFGERVTFTPVARFTLNPFATHPIVDDLIVRVDRARANRRT